MLRRITTLSGVVAIVLICAFLPLDAREYGHENEVSNMLCA